VKLNTVKPWTIASGIQRAGWVTRTRPTWRVEQDELPGCHREVACGFAPVPVAAAAFETAEARSAGTLRRGPRSNAFAQRCWTPGPLGACARMAQKHEWGAPATERPRSMDHGSAPAYFMLAMVVVVLQRDAAGETRAVHLEEPPAPRPGRPWPERATRCSRHPSPPDRPGTRRGSCRPGSARVLDDAQPWAICLWTGRHSSPAPLQLADDHLEVGGLVRLDHVEHQATSPVNTRACGAGCGAEPC